MASGLSKRVRAIECAVVLLDHFHDRLRYLQPTMNRLVESACSLGQLAEAGYLTGCRDAMRRGEPFPRSWREGLKRWPGALGKEETELMEALADTLGVTDLDRQLTALCYTRERLEHRLETARLEREKHHKLYGALGVLAGLAIAIILI